MTSQPMVRFRLLPILTVGSLIALLSCTGNDSATTKKTGATAAAGAQAQPSGTNPANACSLLTEEEAKAVLGGPVKNGMSTESMCQYISDSEELSKAGESVSVQMNYNGAGDFDTYVAAIEKDLNVTTKPVEGIGDRAIFAEGQLIVLKGQDFMTVIIGKKIAEGEQLAAAKMVAQKAIDRLAAAK